MIAAMRARILQTLCVGGKKRKKFGLNFLTRAGEKKKKFITRGHFQSENDRKIKN